MTEGIPASSSTAPLTSAPIPRPATSARKTAVRMPSGMPRRDARRVPATEVRITYRMPNFGSEAVGFHWVPNRILAGPICRMAGIPLFSIYTVMEATASRAMAAQIVHSICAAASWAAFLFLYLM